MATITWVCRNCGNQTRNAGNVPLPSSTGKCKGTPTGQHVWMKAD